MSSPTQRSLKHLRDAGYECAIVEKWNAFAKIRQDAFNFIDILALHPAVRGVIAIQTTSASNIAKRFTKIISEPRAKLWCECGNSIILHGWKKGKNGRWVLDAREVKIGECSSDGC